MKKLSTLLGVVGLIFLLGACAKTETHKYSYDPSTATKSVVTYTVKKDVVQQQKAVNTIDLNKLMKASGVDPDTADAAQVKAAKEQVIASIKKAVAANTAIDGYKDTIKISGDIITENASVDYTKLSKTNLRKVLSSAGGTDSSKATYVSWKKTKALLEKQGAKELK